jgi:hypothetical protein
MHFLRVDLLLGCVSEHKGSQDIFSLVFKIAPALHAQLTKSLDDSSCVLSSTRVDSSVHEANLTHVCE